MASTINFGIDLGTTNSLITKYTSGKVEVFKNQIGHKETLPSVVAFRKERILVGDKAKEYVEKDPDNVFSSFKRKMGTNESFHIKSLQRTITPIELSAIVLRELKNFVYTNEPVPSVVITIPASFDTVQSIATQKAGFEAGFKEVVLLQEPIAASLAYANGNETESQSGKWLVYDLGGGTFDVALIRTDEREMRVIDHEGNNFLGGLDFDNLIIDKIIVPYIKQKGKFTELEKELKNSSGKYNQLYYKLLHKAEEAKVLLSINLQADIEFEIEDDEDEEHDICLTVTRQQFEACIQPYIESTIEMIRSILERNNLNTNDINHILMVGGSTYIPYVRQTIKNSLNIPVNFSIDPSTAIAVGAAYYAGSKAQTFHDDAEHATIQSDVKPVNIRMGYQKSSQDSEEYFVAEIVDDNRVVSYRIVREDGGFDTGLKKYSDRIMEMLPLLKNAFNTFTIKLFDAENNPLPVDQSEIGIMQGKFNIVGQPLPHDICIEVDDFENNTTKLEVIFEKNAILPIRKTITREISKTIQQNSNESIIINILEGDRYSSPSSNQAIGTIEISSKDVNRTIVKGSDVEITVEISESRELKVSTYLMMTDQEFSGCFSPSSRQVNLFKLKDDSHTLLLRARQELKNLEKVENYENAAKAKRIVDELSDMYQQLGELSRNDVTDLRYQIEDRMRKASRQFDNLTVDTHIVQVKAEYFEAKSSCEHWVTTKGTDDNKRAFERLIENEKVVLASNNKQMIALQTSKLGDLRWQLQQKDPYVVIMIFHHYADLSSNNYNNEEQAKRLIEMGEKALERKNYEELLSVCYRLHSLLPPEKKDEFSIKGTGIG
jgi:molecular chaperone DnaK